MINKKKIISIIPAFNEKGKIGGVVKSVPKDIVNCMLVVNDGSTDSTYNEAVEAGALVISHEKHLGLGSALRTGINYALENSFDIITIMAGNGKDDGAEIPNLLNPIINEGYDYAQGSRYLDGGKIGGKMPLSRKFGTRLYPLLLKLTTGFPATDGTNGFRAYKTSIFDDKRIDINQKWLNGVSFEFYLHLKVLELGYKVKEVPVTKIYPQQIAKFSYKDNKSYTKTRPIIDWWRIIKPLICLKLKIKK